MHVCIYLCKLKIRLTRNIAILKRNVSLYLLGIKHKKHSNLVYTYIYIYIYIYIYYIYIAMYVSIKKYISANLQIKYINICKYVKKYL